MKRHPLCSHTHTQSACDGSSKRTPGPRHTLPWISPHHQTQGFWDEVGERESAFCPWGQGGPTALCLRGDTKRQSTAQATVTLSFTQQGPNPCDKQGRRAGYSHLNPLEPQLSPHDKFILQKGLGRTPETPNILFFALTFHLHCHPRLMER